MQQALGCPTYALQRDDLKMPCKRCMAWLAPGALLCGSHTLQVKQLHHGTLPRTHGQPSDVSRNTPVRCRTLVPRALAVGRYGKQLVPVTELEEAALRAPLEDKALKVVGFVPRERIMRHQFMKVSALPRVAWVKGL